MAEIPSELQAEVEKLERKHLENPAGRYFVPLANAYRKLGELQLAEERLREGLRKHPDYLSAHIVLGRVLADRGASVEAAEEFRYVLSVDPQNLIALRTLGELAMAEGRTEEAGRWYRELLGVDPMNDEARQALSELDARAADPDEGLDAEQEFEGGGWWTQSAQASGAPAPALEGVAHGPMDDWAGPAAELEAAPPAPEAGQPYLGGMNGEFLIGEAAGAEPLVDLEAGYGNDYAPGYAGEAGSEDEDAEFVTETIAELYARQGFYDRAAEVYRELIRQRGADEGLERRLAEIERMDAGLPPLTEDVAEEVQHEVAADEELPVLEGLDLDTLGGGPAAEPAWAAEDEGSAFADSFAAGFGDAMEVEAQVEEPAPTLAEEADEDEADEGEVAAVHAAEGATVAGVLGELLAWRAPRPSAATGMQDEEGIVEVGAMATAEADEPSQTFSFDEYFAAESATEPAPAPAAAPAPAPEPAAAPAASDEEEDLESFQAWLRSLKR